MTDMSNVLLERALLDRREALDRVAELEARLAVFDELLDAADRAHDKRYAHQHCPLCTAVKKAKDLR